MKAWFSKRVHQIIHHWPLLLVIVTALVVSLANATLDTSYAGWDNIHAELNLPQYAGRVFFGAWQEHQGLGGPAAKGHLAEVTRLPILFLFKFLLPANFHRYAFIFLMYIIGGITMYTYLYKAWIKDKDGSGPFLAAVGGIFYLLHVLTLQQFYISFEMFMVQFAFFPLMLLSIHWISKKMSAKNVLAFIGVQLLLAASAHTPTVFYLGILSSLLYALLLQLSETKNLLKALAFTFMVGLFTGIANGFWIVPNLYYSVNNSSYVAESKANVLFGPEALWSIREASTLPSFLSGLHYLMTWKDYNFVSGEHELIFAEWQNHFAWPFTKVQMYGLGIMSVLGSLLAFADRKKGWHRFAVSLLYMVFAAFIWIELFPTKHLILPLYESKTFLEAFRNPFTKLSIIYSFFLIVVFVQLLENIIEFAKTRISLEVGKIVAIIAVALSAAAILRIAEPAFKGYFISEKLKVSYPEVYSELYAFMETKDHNARVLEMPYLSREGWVFYDWPTAGYRNGYQGIGFYFFGFPQPFLTPDFARWSETNDFFYEELKQTVNNYNAGQLSEITAKYHIPLIIIDESRMSPHVDHEFALDHQLVSAAGFEKIWEKDYVSVYEKTANHMTGPLIVPTRIAVADAPARRVKIDVAYDAFKDYVSDSPYTSEKFFPFASLLKEEIPEIVHVSDEVTQIATGVPENTYALHIPAITDETYTTTMHMQRSGSSVQFTFPQYSIIAASKRVPIPQLLPQAIDLSTDTNSFYINGKEFYLPDGEESFVELTIKNDSVFIFSKDPAGDNIVHTYTPDWTNIAREVFVPLEGVSDVTLQVEFPAISADLTKRPSENCARPDVLGSIETTYEGSSALYTASDFAVNCNSTDLSFMTPASSYILMLKGENFEGRSLKFFVNYAPGESLHEEYLLPEGPFEKNYTLTKITTNLFSQFFINWETRSFGNESKNRLEALEVLPVPLHRLANVSLTIPDAEVSVPNEITVLQNKKFFDFIYKTHVSCATERCFVGTNEAYDDLWIAIDHSKGRIAPHMHYNSWANMWEVREGDTQLTIIYIPQVIALVGMLVLLSTVVYLLRRALLKNSDALSRKQAAKKRAKQTYRTPKRVLAGIHRRKKL